MLKSSSQILDEGKENEPVWVLNTAMNSPFLGGATGKVLIPIADAAGKITTIVVQRTWLPQNLTDQIPRKQLKESTNLRQSLDSKKLIRLLTSAEAQQIMARPGADKERQRLEKAVTYSTQTQASRGQTEEFEVEVFDPLAATGVGNANAGIISDESLSKVPFDTFKEILKACTDIEAVNAMKNRGQFTRNELEILKMELDGKSLCQKAIQISLVAAAKKKKK